MLVHLLPPVLTAEGCDGLIRSEAKQTEPGKWVGPSSVTRPSVAPVHSLFLAGWLAPAYCFLRQGRM